MNRRALIVVAGLAFAAHSGWADDDKPIPPQEVEKELAALAQKVNTVPAAEVVEIRAQIHRLRATAEQKLQLCERAERIVTAALRERSPNTVTVPGSPYPLTDIADNVPHGLTVVACPPGSANCPLPSASAVPAPNVQAAAPEMTWYYTPTATAVAQPVPIPPRSALPVQAAYTVHLRLPEASIPESVKRLAELRQKKADLEREEQALVDSIKRQVAEQKKLLELNGIGGEPKPEQQPTVPSGNYSG